MTSTTTRTTSVSARAPIQEEGQRQQHEHGDDGGKLVLEEGEPQPEQAVRPAQHHLHQPARVDVPVKRERQGQHVAEVAVHHRQAVAVRHALGMQRRRDGGQNRPGADGEPDAEQLRRLRPEGVRRHGVRPGEQADHAAEQHRVEELQRRDHDVGERQHEHQAAVPRQDGQGTAINLGEAHGTIRGGQVTGALDP